MSVVAVGVILAVVLFLTLLIGGCTYCVVFCFAPENSKVPRSPPTAGRARCLRTLKFERQSWRKLFDSKSSNDPPPRTVRV